MRISHLEHFLIIADDIEKTTSWYVDNLGFSVGETPDFGVPVNWLYLGDRDVIHVAQSNVSNSSKRPVATRSEITRGGRPIHHVAFRASGLDETLVHLQANEIEYVEQQANGQNVYQVFLQDPNGITVELNFSAEEAAGRQAPKLALTLARTISCAPSCRKLDLVLPHAIKSSKSRDFEFDVSRQTPSSVTTTVSSHKKPMTPWM